MAIMVGAGQVEEVWAEGQGLIIHLSRPVLAGRGRMGRARRRGEDDWGLRRGIAAPSRPYGGIRGWVGEPGDSIYRNKIQDISTFSTPRTDMINQ